MLNYQQFDVETGDGSQLTLVYSSNRPFALLAKGLIQGCIDYFQDSISFTFEDQSGGAMTKAKFVLTRG